MNSLYFSQNDPTGTNPKTLKYFSGTDLEVNQCVNLFKSFQEAPALLMELPERGGERALQRDSDIGSAKMEE